ncbi:MAG: VOC family protein [Bacteroidota bacterium]
MKLNLLVIRSPDPDQLVPFYEAWGLRFAHHRHGSEPLHYAAEMNELVFEIYPCKYGQTPSIHIRLGFEMEDVKNVLEKVSTSGGMILQDLQQTEFGKVAIVQDPEGRKLELKEI